ncbi:MAG: polysaccharide biosynthesis tyrosine autokinase [Anaeromyxobacter sp.]|nr:polysaccharide biosynthesis tyrosine autokinase [Anaeromyxobacter sp.]
MTDTRNYQPEPSTQVGERRDAFDLHAYWRTIVRRRWLVLPFFVATVLVTAIVTLRQTKIFDATCTIIIDLSAPKVLDKESVQDVMEAGTGGYWYSREYYETQYRVLTSRAVGQRVVDKLQLATNLAFLAVDEIKDPAAQEQARLRKDPVTILLRNLKVEPVKDSRVVRIRYEAADPQFAALAANTVADSYIAESLSVRTVTTQNASEWLEQQLADLEKKLDQSGMALFEFKKSHDIVATSWEDRQSMVSQRLTAFNDALTKARVRKAELQARNDAIEAAGAAVEKGEGEIEALQPVASSPAIQQLKIRFLEATSECADLRVKYLEEHPKTQACDKKVQLARQGLKDEIKLSLDSARREYQEVVKTERNLQVLLNETKTDAFGLNQYERDYLELKRTYDNNARLYELVLKRLKDTGVSGMLQVSNVRVLDRARATNRPIRPNVTQNVVLAVFLGLLGGLALAFVADYADRTITSQAQIEENLGLTFLGIVPTIARSRDGTPQDLFVHTQPKSAAAECLRAVRTNLLFMSPEKPLRTILVTSSGPQEGKTTTATSLAITMAGSGNRVLLVDADMRRPRIHRIFGVGNQAGLSSLILGEGRLLELAKPTGIENLFVLPCGPVPPNPAELLHTAAFQKLVTEMAGAFDRVIIDSPPVGVVADAVVIGTHVDGTLLVLKASKTSREVARQAVRQLRDVKAPLFGAVLNDLDLEDQRYGQYSYYYRYGYYYGEDKGRGAKPETSKA